MVTVTYKDAEKYRLLGMCEGGRGRSTLLCQCAVCVGKRRHYREEKGLQSRVPLVLLGGSWGEAE